MTTISAGFYKSLSLGKARRVFSRRRQRLLPLFIFAQILAILLYNSPPLRHPGKWDTPLPPPLPPLPPLRTPLPKMPRDVAEALDLLAADHLGEDVVADPRRRPAFVQIGANDGRRNDPLYEPMLSRHRFWNGLLVEPQPRLHEKLVSLHVDKAGRWGTFNGLVSPSCGDGGTLEFCESVMSGKEQNGERKLSFGEQGQANSVGMGFCDSKYGRGDRPLFVRVDRQCVRDVKTLVEDYGPAEGAGVGRLIQPDRIDLLQIDAEGHDFLIIQSIDFDSAAPRCISYEALASAIGTREESVPFLEQRGYTLAEPTSGNMLACQVMKQN